jgi:hypothetical protein
MNGYFKWFSYFVLSLAALLILYIGFNLLYPYQTMSVENPAPVLNKIVRQGETLAIKLNYEKFTDKPCVVTRQFINDIVYVMPSYSSDYPKGKDTKISYSTKVPAELPPGEYYVRVTLEYSFPPFRTITYTYVTEKFTVIK